MTTEPKTARSLFLVEDNDWDSKLAMRMLKRLGLDKQTLILHDGKEALDALQTLAHDDPAGLPGLILLDLNLPSATGLQVLQWVRADPRTNALPVAILTGHDDDQLVVEIYKLGVSAYFTKPLEPGKLSDLLMKLEFPHLPLAVEC